jgi:hypothetical protein
VTPQRQEMLHSVSGGAFRWRIRHVLGGHGGAALPDCGSREHRGGVVQAGSNNVSNSVKYCVAWMGPVNAAKTRPEASASALATVIVATSVGERPLRRFAA